jgi:16S rRNA (adenine1518-N6/adenine1519-N6)-dimethyltransferase
MQQKPRSCFGQSGRCSSFHATTIEGIVIRQSVVAKKRLGQNFLHDPNVIRRIVASLELATTDIVLEIGCGTGALTRHLASKPRQFIGVELDKSLFRTLTDQNSSPSVLFLNQDILQLDIAALLHTLGQTLVKVKVVGNLPYYISSPIIEWLGKQSRVIESATTMLQSEVADRLMASPGTKEFGVLSLVASYHFADKTHGCRPGAFQPVRKCLPPWLGSRNATRAELEKRISPFWFIKRFATAQDLVGTV